MVRRRRPLLPEEKDRRTLRQGTTGRGQANARPVAVSPTRTQSLRASSSGGAGYSEIMAFNDVGDDLVSATYEGDGASIFTFSFSEVYTNTAGWFMASLLGKFADDDTERSLYIDNSAWPSGVPTLMVPALGIQDLFISTPARHNDAGDYWSFGTSGAYGLTATVTFLGA